MRIGDVASLVGLSVYTLRYYEKIGLVRLSEKERQSNNYRDYDQGTINLILSLKNLRAMGFTISDIKTLKKSWDQNELNCVELNDLVTKKIDQLSMQINMLELSKKRLNSVSINCLDCFDTVRLLSNHNFKSI